MLDKTGLFGGERRCGERRKEKTQDGEGEQELHDGGVERNMNREGEGRRAGFIENEMEGGGERRLDRDCGDKQGAPEPEQGCVEAGKDGGQERGDELGMFAGKDEISVDYTGVRGR